VSAAVDQGSPAEAGANRRNRHHPHPPHTPNIFATFAAAAAVSSSAISRHKEGKVKEQVVASTLRRAVDVVGVLAGAGALVVVAVVGLKHYRTQQAFDVVTAGLREFERTLAVQANLGEAELTRSGWPTTMNPAWFSNSPPRNPFMPPEAAWLEVAPEIEANLLDPPARVAPDEFHAGFWYNPYRGIVRARVPLVVSESQSVELYNRINGRAVRSGYEANLTAIKAAVDSEASTEEASDTGDGKVAKVPVTGDGKQ
jgi:hypothetical protein